MSFFTVAMLARWYQRMTGTPSGPTRNFSKFHLMSWFRRGSQKRFLGFPNSSATGGQEFCKVGATGQCLVCPPPQKESALGAGPPLWHCTHLQEAVDLLLLGPVHIPFLEELEVGDEAASWPDIPAGGQ